MIVKRRNTQTDLQSNSNKQTDAACERSSSCATLHVTFFNRCIKELYILGSCADYIPHGEKDNLPSPPSDMVSDRPLECLIFGVAVKTKKQEVSGSFAAFCLIVIVLEIFIACYCELMDVLNDPRKCIHIFFVHIEKYTIKRFSSVCSLKSRFGEVKLS